MTGRQKQVPRVAPPPVKDQRRRKWRDANAAAMPLPPGLEGKKAVPKTKHKTWIEIVDNDERRKPLEFEYTTSREPPPLFSFVPIGNADLTTCCKDLSRERGAMVYIVSNRKGQDDLSQQVGRVGYHFRQTIVQDAMASLGLTTIYDPQLAAPDGISEIPESQQEINAQADAALRELFPKIPHTDRGEIISHAFRKGRMFHGEPVVGLQEGLPLSRRVQLAVLAHIRHNHTRYDELLRETTWHNARKATQEVCLEYLVKWRGDDESGRDQMEEILREVIVLSDDDESEDGDSDSDAASASGASDDVVMLSSNPVTPSTSAPVAAAEATGAQAGSTINAVGLRRSLRKRQVTSTKQQRPPRKRTRKDGNRGFSRYQMAWDKAASRQQALAAASQAPGPSAVTYGPGEERSRHDIHPRAPGHYTPPVIAGDVPTPPYQGVRSRAGTVDLPMVSPYASSGPPQPTHFVFTHSADMPDLNEAGYGAPTGHRRPSAPVREANRQLQDMLHPSIEPTSPNAPSPHHQSLSRSGPPPLEPLNSHPSQSGRRGSAIQDYNREAPQNPAPYPSHTRTASGYNVSSHPVGPRDYRMPPLRITQPPPLMTTTVLDEGFPTRSELRQRQGQPDPDWSSGERFVSRFARQPERLVPSSRGPITNVLGDGSQFVEIRRGVQGRETGLHPADGPSPVARDGFVVLREAPPRPTQTPHFEEGFIQIRHASAGPQRRPSPRHVSSPLPRTLQTRPLTPIEGYRPIDDRGVYAETAVHRYGFERRGPL